MTVSGGNGYYEIDCNFTTFEGYTVTCKYSGELTVQNVPQGFSTLEGDYTLDLFNSVAKAQCWGDYYGTGGANWVLEISPADGTTGDGFSTDFVSYSTDNTFIESGSYVASEAECVNGIISGYTYPGQYLKGYYNQISNFGKFMDPLADKVLVAAGRKCGVIFGMGAEKPQVYGWRGREPHHLSKGNRSGGKSAPRD